MFYQLWHTHNRYRKDDNASFYQWELDFFKQARYNSDSKNWTPEFILEKVQDLLKRCSSEKMFEGQSELILELSVLKIKLTRALKKRKSDSVNDIKV